MRLLLSPAEDQGQRFPARTLVVHLAGAEVPLINRTLHAYWQ